MLAIPFRKKKIILREKFQVNIISTTVGVLGKNIAMIALIE